MVFPAVHEARVRAQRDVVEEEPVVRAPDVDHALDAVVERSERRNRVVAIEPDIAGEVVARAERDADERQAPLDRDVGNRGERAVAARHAERVGSRVASDRLHVVAVAQDVRLEPRSCAAASNSSAPPSPERGLTIRKPVKPVGSTVRCEWADRLMYLSARPSIIARCTTAAFST